jgi:diguanylate cyclase (GGDEF)-like protein
MGLPGGEISTMTLSESDGRWQVGHPAGDEALRVFANTLRSCMREGDIAARYGGEEFAVLLPGIDHASALVIAERIRLRTETMIVSLAPGVTDRITISAGIATAPDQATDRLSLLRLADQALYVAKSTGRNRVASLVGLDPPAAPQLPAVKALVAGSR